MLWVVTEIMLRNSRDLEPNPGVGYGIFIAFIYVYRMQSVFLPFCKSVDVYHCVCCPCVVMSVYDLTLSLIHMST